MNTMIRLVLIASFAFITVNAEEKVMLDCHLQVVNLLWGNTNVEVNTVDKKHEITSHSIPAASEIVEFPSCGNLYVEWQYNHTDPAPKHFVDLKTCNGVDSGCNTTSIVYGHTKDMVYNVAVSKKNRTGTTVASIVIVNLVPNTVVNWTLTDETDKLLPFKSLANTTVGNATKNFTVQIRDEFNSEGNGTSYNWTNVLGNFTSNGGAIEHRVYIFIVYGNTSLDAKAVVYPGHERYVENINPFFQTVWPWMIYGGCMVMGPMMWTLILMGRTVLSADDDDKAEEMDDKEKGDNPKDLTEDED